MRRPSAGAACRPLCVTAWLLTWHFRLTARCRRRFHRRGRGLPGDAEGVGNALVGGSGLAVNAVGVDLEQDRDAVPGAAGDVRVPPQYRRAYPR